MTGPLVLFLALCAVSAGLAIAGAYILAGPGVACLAGAVSTALAAAFVQRGMTVAR